jgi:polyhydroxyalkanoate synthesis regulator phasin
MMDPTTMMAPQKMFKQMLTFNKTAFENSLKGITMLQEQNDKMAKTMIDQATWLPEEGKKALDNMSTAYKSAFDNFKTAMDDYFKKAEEYISE